jgi:hypothetical protein
MLIVHTLLSVSINMFFNQQNQILDVLIISILKYLIPQTKDSMLFEDGPADHANATG